MQTNTKFSNRLAMLRKNMGETQVTFAEKFSDFMLRKEPFAPVTISSWENGTKIPTATVLLYLCQFLGVSADYLLGLTDDIGDMKGFTEGLKKTPDIKIDPRQLKGYSKEPVFVVFTSKKHRSRWGLLDYEKDRIIFTDMILKDIKNSGCEFYTSVPDKELEPGYAKKKPYSMSQLQEQTDKIWVKMLSSDSFIEGKYNGWYRHNEDHSALINTIGLTLPYEGLGISYNAYPSDIR